MKSLARIGALVAAIGCVTTFSAVQPAQAHNHDREQQEQQQWRRAAREQAEQIHKQQEMLARAYASSFVTCNNPYLTLPVTSYVAPYQSQPLYTSVNPYGYMPYIATSFQVNHPVISSRLQRLSL